MGKKYRNLFEQISNIDNLRDAYKKVIKNGNRCKRTATNEGFCFQHQEE